ncbi:c-type cytochrome [Shewanella olleyana]|uniref:cytochrome-c peroxidase n=1 Tax=Shewanella olleyana TaxID=135626 RepID=UPI00200FCEA3|nr:cytochrome c peroxidase [Shewanella olleyana]MCL1067946.1 c-type cytochrome [Shewanella olleyana]
MESQIINKAIKVQIVKGINSPSSWLKACALIALALTFSPVFSEPLATPDIDDIEYPEDEAPNQMEVELGKILFFDPILSANNQMSCATCHDPNNGFGDGLKLSIGHDDKPLTRHTPHLYNLAWAHSLFWDGRAPSLEHQVLMPVFDPSEMNLSQKQMLERIELSPFYKTQFNRVFQQDNIDTHLVSLAIAAFMRSIISSNSPFDQYLAGDTNAISTEAVSGLKLFEGKAKCVECHDGANLTDGSYHSLGIARSDKGRGFVINDDSMNFRFKTPGLRNVSLTAPYMHDGSIADLEGVIRFYNDGGGTGPNKDNLMEELNLTEGEIRDLIAFLAALTQPISIARPSVPNNFTTDPSIQKKD